MSPSRRPPPPRRRTGRTGGPATPNARRSSPPAGGRPSAAKGLGGEQVEGRQAVREMLVAGRRRVKDIWLAEGVDDAPILGDILDLAGELRVPVRSVTRLALENEARSEAPQGILAHAAPLPPAELDSLCRPPDGSAPFLVALDSVTDPQNLGALLRTAECAGATGAVLPRHRSAHVTPTVAKAAAGAVEYLPIALVGGLPAALARAKELGVWVVGLDAGRRHLASSTCRSAPNRWPSCSAPKAVASDA